MTDFQGLNRFDGPKWWFSYSGIEFDMPFTRQHISLPPIYSYALSFLSSILFVFVVTVIFPRIKPSNKDTIKSIAFWHYFGLFAYSTCTCLAAFYVILVRDQWSPSNTEDFYCGHVPDWFRVVSISFIFSKYWEWVDTALLVWNGKTLNQIGFLHFYHHMTTVWVFSLTSNFPGCDKLGIALNSFVHALMYAHYCFRLPRFMRPIITSAQIVQLAVGTLSWGWNYHACAEFQGVRESDPFTYWSLWAFVPTFLVMFIRFFVQTYLVSSSIETKSAASTTASVVPPKSQKQD
jgi:hypothetical protein